MNKINKKNILIFSIIFIITCIIFFPFIKGHYATDTYNVANVGYQNYAIKWSLNDGRIFMFIITSLASKMQIPIEWFVFITLILALLTSCICVIYIKSIIEKYKKSKNIWQEIITIIISYVTIFNFMYIEDMYFVECFVMSISILIFIIAANILVQKEKNSTIKSFLLVLIGIMFYQGTICIYFAMTFLLTILKNKNNLKQILKDLIKCGIIALISVLLNIALVNIIGNIFNMQQTRLGSIENILRNIQIICITTHEILIYTCNLYPAYLFIILVFAITILVITYVISNKMEKNIIIKLISLIIISILSSCIIFIMAMTSYYTGRLRFSIGATIGLILIFIYVDTNMFQKEKIIKYTMIGILLFYLISNICMYINLMLQHKQVNKLEREEIQQIEEYISKYEAKTKNKITKIIKVPVVRKSEKAYYDCIPNKSTFTYTAVRSELAADGVVNFYTKRNLETVKITTENMKLYKEYIDSNEKGYECIDDTFYIEVYMF